MNPRIPNPGMTRLGLGFLATVVAFAAGGADPRQVEYRSQPDRLFWFVQITDSQITTGRPARAARLAWASHAALEQMDSEIVVHTGDLVDHTGGAVFPFADVTCYPEEWTLYRTLIEDVATSESWIDLPGNHDQYGDGDLTCYRRWSVQGEATSQVQHARVLSFPYGSYLIVGLATCAEDGARWPIDNANLAPNELKFLEDVLRRHPEAQLVFIFGHHPISGRPYLSGGDRDAFVELMSRYRVSSYAHGHTRSAALTYQGDRLVANLAPLALTSGRNLALFTIDGNGLRVRLHDVGTWPVIQITAPLDLDLGGQNPLTYPVPAGWRRNPIRAVAFDPDGIARVRFRIDGGQWIVMSRFDEHVYQGTWDTLSLDPGVHELTVEVEGENGIGVDSIRVEVRMTECVDGIDNDDNGWSDYPHDPGCDSPSDDAEAGVETQPE